MTPSPSPALSALIRLRLANLATATPHAIAMPSLHATGPPRAAMITPQLLAAAAAAAPDPES
jgi:hypothetical protein